LDAEIEKRSKALERRIGAALPKLPVRPDLLIDEIRRCLGRATDSRKLKGGFNAVTRLLKHETTRNVDDERIAIYGGKRTDSDGQSHFERVDGCRFNFFVLAEYPKSGEPVLVVYHFHFIRVAPRLSEPTFFRFDLADPNYSNGGQDLRSHFHPGLDHFSVPSPILSPLELLEIILYRA
jgi:hypothetical protein